MNIRKNLKEALSELSRRGPDDSGTLLRDKCVLGHTRLSILDLSGGHQPMKDSKKNIWLSFNGEIYNFLELRSDLISKGHTFATEGDSEVILKAYKEYGEHCVEKLDGMFAFAIWDEENDIFLIARDRFGKKPLYMMNHDSGIICASEIKALISLTKKKFTLNATAIDEYLRLMYIPPNMSIYKEINPLLPAHYMVFSKGDSRTVHYWKLKHNPISVSYADAKREIKNLLSKAVSKRMVADVEIGSLLSGGVDSTLVSILAHNEIKNKLKTFSVRYGNEINETPYAKQVSKKIQSEHFVIDAHNRDIISELTTILRYLDEPHGDSSLFPQHIVSELASSKVKVALSGDGADEFFMGYGWYTKWNNLPKIKWLKTRLFSNRLREYFSYINIFSNQERKKLWKKEYAKNIQDDTYTNRTNRDNIKSINDFDINVYLPGQLLSKIDSTSMMHGLEIRSPFLDTQLAEYVYNLPTEFKMKGNMNKIILKDILCEYMPKDFVYRRKQGFGAPTISWLKNNDVKVRIYEMTKETSHVAKFFDYTYIKKLADNFYKGENELHQKLWIILSLEIWLSIHHPA